MAFCPEYMGFLQHFETDTAIQRSTFAVAIGQQQREMLIHPGITNMYGAGDGFWMRPKDH
ncbi:hypothetical protein D3C81_2097390 [compost metagenome]